MNGKFWGNIVFGAVLFCLAGFAVAKISASSGVEGLLLPEVKVSDSTAELLHSVTLTSFDVSPEKEGHVVTGKFSIENKGPHDVKNISILCSLYDAKGKEQGRDKWIAFSTVKSNSSEPFEIPNEKYISDSVVRAECQIVDLEVAKAPLITVQRGGGHGGHGEAAHGQEHGSTH